MQYACFSNTHTLGTLPVQIRDLVTKPCPRSSITATQHMTSPLRDTVHACDGDTGTFYHSVEKQAASPFFTIQLASISRIKTITVVNVHTGAHCRNNAKDCTERIDGAKVEVLKAGMRIRYCQTSNYL